MSFASDPRTNPDSVVTIDADTGNETSRKPAARIAIRHMFDIVSLPFEIRLPFAAELPLRWNS